MNWFYSLAEILIICTAMIGLTAGVIFPKPLILRQIRNCYIIVLICCTLLLAYQLPSLEQRSSLPLFGSLFIASYFTASVKIILLLATSVLIWQIQDVADDDYEANIEFSTLILLSLTGLMIMISASDLLGVFVGLELSALPGYVLAAYRRNQIRSAEAGVKYVLLGAIATGLFVYGMSLVYGATGSTHLEQIGNTLLEQDNFQLALIIGMVFIITAVAFKVAAVPLHMWIPDVYEGASNYTVVFFASASKCGAFLLMVVLCVRFFPTSEQSQWLLQSLAILSMVVGSIGAVAQNNIKRLLAYSSITHTGFLLMGLAALNFTRVSSVLYYLVIYVIMTLGAFGIVILMVRDGTAFTNIKQLAGSFRHSPGFAFCVLVLMFSLAGFPPLGGFFAKYSVLAAALSADLYLLAVVGVLASVVSAYYYLRIVKIIYFDEAIESMDKMPRRTFITLAVSCILMLSFALYNQPLLALTQKASLALLFE